MMVFGPLRLEEHTMSMIKLNRKEGEKILIGDDVVIVIDQIGGGRVKIMIEAPEHVTVLRSELVGSDPLPPARQRRSDCEADGGGPEILARPKRVRIEAV